ncbi:MAG: elongation factor G [Acidimicrobiaceae bacterium]|nr:elongation factor G [Acidimicrobiaceae bacterium]MDE0515578.1 elongation factor G [Acidimicrobiaceae bacterium]MXZ94859.1 elongation factor G [Acidimicrobiaceae bacterium]MYF43352.1 elongation factor G [Acidimicrobiaceae bacterium]MYJ35910.1 elongation factor G [Acidimicrobiaceae bacterium]
MSSQSIRNVVLVGHNGNGKTTLAEAMLYRAGVLSRMGRVDDGTAHCDHDPEEKARHQSLGATVASFDWRDHRVNIIDTPGYTDFVSEAVNGMHAADLAVFVVDAVSGVQAQDQVMWRHAERLGLPRMVFVNGLDRERSSFERTLDGLQSHFGSHVEAVELPLGVEASFHGIADLVGDGALDYSSGQSAAAPIPDDVASAASDGHIQLVEDVVEGDDELLEQYLEGEEPTQEQLEQLIRTAVVHRNVFPVLCGSAAKPIGVDHLLDFICRAGPAPGDTGPVAAVRGGEAVTLEIDDAGPPVVLVFKTRIDDFLGQISFMKVLSGTIRSNETLVNSRTGDKERLHNLMSFTGADHHAVDHFDAGDIVAVTKLGDVRTGDTLSNDAALSVPITPPPVPVYGVAVHATAPAQEDKLASALRRFATEDPSLLIRQDPTTRQTVLSGAGEAHIRVVRSRLDRMGIDFEVENMRVAYLETLARPADVEAKHKKQSGGHGQFAVAMVRFEPLPRGGGYEFDTEVTGGAIPRNLIPAVGAGIEDAMANGGRHGFPMVDLRAVCYDGKHHSVDSSEMAFKIAGSLALKQAVEQVGSAVLEPISEIQVEVPDAYQGDVLGDLNSRRGQVFGTEPGSTAGTSVIRAHVPTSEILSYVIDLRSMTGGTGTFSAEHHDYQPLPHALLAKVVVADD